MAGPEAEADSVTARELPLFPLGTVLFPGAPLQLHVFEQRYREMIGRCLETGSLEFGVLLIKEGDEVVEPRLPEQPAGRPATPYDVGTVARILEVERLPGGRLLLTCRGEQRFRVRRLVQETPYSIGEVEPYEDQPPNDDPAAPSSLENLCGAIRLSIARLLQAIAAAATPGQGAAEGDRQLQELAAAVPPAPEALSYFVPRLLANAWNEEKQALLESQRLRRRLELEVTLLYRERQVVERLVNHGQTHRPSLN